MPLSAEPLALSLKAPFRIAHGTSTTRRNVLVQLGEGLGEGALPPYYPYTMEEVLAYVHALDGDALLAREPIALEDAIDGLPPGPAPARAAVDLALHDHWGRQLGHPLYRLWGLNPLRAPHSSVTLSIPEELAALREQVHAYTGFPVLKLKVGTGGPDRDEAIVRTAREATGAQLCVDANGAWSVDEAAAVIPRLSRYDLLFVEQPLAGDAVPEAWQALRDRLPEERPPLIADESVQDARDVLALADAVDGINVKLTKAGGLHGARRLITLARALGLHVMLGCMVESAIAVTAAAHLAPLVDYADLDASLLLAEDPFQGMTLDHGRILLPDGPGLGVTSR